MPWFRFYDEVVDDPKVQQLSDQLFKSWVNCMCISKQNGGVLPPTKSLAFKLHVSPEQAEIILKDLMNANLVDRRKDKKFEMHNWDGRQFESDNSTKRVKRFREKRRNVSETAGETGTPVSPLSLPPHPPLIPLYRTETEQNKQSFVFQSEFNSLWENYPNKDGRKDAERHFNGTVKTEQDLADIRQAFANYQEHLGKNGWKHAKSGKTWFNNWRDWINWAEPVGGSSNGNERQGAVRRGRSYTSKQTHH